MQICRILAKNKAEEPIQQTELNIFDVGAENGLLNRMSQGLTGRNACGYLVSWTKSGQLAAIVL